MPAVSVSYRQLSNGATITLVDSGVPGPSILILTGQDGLETSAILGALTLLDKLILIRSGKVIVCPCLNVPGFLSAQSHYPITPTNRDLVEATQRRVGPGEPLHLDQVWQWFDMRGLLHEFWQAIEKLLNGLPSGALNLRCSTELANTVQVAELEIGDGLFDTTENMDVAAFEFWCARPIPHNTIQNMIDFTANEPPNDFPDPIQPDPEYPDTLHDLYRQWRVSYKAAPPGSMTVAMHDIGVPALTVTYHPQAQPDRIAQHLFMLLTKVLGTKD